MKNLKNTLLFRVALLLIINCFVHNIVVLVLSLFYLLMTDKKETMIFLVLLLLICISNNLSQKDYLKYGIVTNVTNSYIEVDKLFYNTKIYTKNNYTIGDIIRTNEYYKEKEIKKIKYNDRFYAYEDPSIVFNLKTRVITNNRLNSFPEEIRIYLSNILFNNYESEIEFIGYGFSFYYLLILIKRKNKIVSIISLFVYILFFRFDIKFYLFIIDLILPDETNRINKLCIKIFILLLINKYLLINYSILLSLLISFVNMADFNDCKSIICLIQSYFFGQINIFNSLFYKYLLNLRIIMLIFSLIAFIIYPLKDFYLVFINIIIKLFSIIKFDIRGQISTISFIIFLLIIKILKIKNEYLKMVVLCLVLLSGINNPFSHLNFVDVGQGDACLIHTSIYGDNILIDTGSSYNYAKLKKALFKEGIYKIDYLIISHDDEDHSGNKDRLKKDFKIKEIIEKGKNIENKNYVLEYLYLGDFENENDNSLVYLLKMNDATTLFTGDISKSVENVIINNYGIRDVDILKIAHHGSKSSSSRYFISNLNPRLITISTSGAYNHPHKETMELLDDYKMNYLITKNEGDIRVYKNIVISNNKFMILK